MAPNAMAPNAMAPNAMAPNAMAPNALTPDALASVALSSSSLPLSVLAATSAPTEIGALARQLVKYSVSCALTPAQQLELIWIDAAGSVHDEVYTGLLGIAPSWASEPLTDNTQQRLVSGCLGARVNYYGVQVLLSLRSAHSPLQTEAGDAELDEFPYIEGVFWGNLFDASPYMSACFDSANVDVSRESLRDCAVGHLAPGGGVMPCGIISLAGPCDTVCNGWNSDGEYYSSCKDHPDSASSALTTAVVTVALR